MKEELYEEFTEIYDNAPRNTVRIIIRDFYSKAGRETYSRPTIGLHSAHKQRNDNSQIAVAFATSRNMKKVAHSFLIRIFTNTCKSPDGHIYNQIDHVH